jgi:chorismate-pyruvate lyase
MWRSTVAGQKVRYRRVQLMCDDHVLSIAENWYVPARLSAQMSKLLAFPEPQLP